jgi:hypothetical protein
MQVPDLNPDTITDLAAMRATVVQLLNLIEAQTTDITALRTAKDFVNQVHVLVNRTTPVAEIEGKMGEKQCFGREFEKVLLHFSEWTAQNRRYRKHEGRYFFHDC